MAGIAGHDIFDAAGTTITHSHEISKLEPLDYGFMDEGSGFGSRFDPAHSYQQGKGVLEYDNFFLFFNTAYPILSPRVCSGSLSM